MLIKRMSERERRIAAAAAAFIAAAVLYSFIILPVSREWQALDNAIESKTSVLKNDIAILAARESLAANYAKFSKYVRSAKSEEESTAETLSYLENLAREDSCLILNMKPIGTKDHGSYKELLIDLSSEASLSQLTKFLYDIETAKNMILKVRHFAVTSKAGEDGILRGSLLIAKVIIE